MKKEELIDLDEVCIGMSELCSILDVTPNAIRNYEKKTGLPVRKTDNGYRYFFFNDVQHCLSIKKYVSLGFSLKDAGKLVFQSSYENVKSLLHEQEAVLQKKITLLQKKKECLRKIESQNIDMKSLAGKIERVTLPDFYWITLTTKGTVLTENKNNKYKEWISHIPFTMPAARIKKEELCPNVVAEIGLLCHDKWVQEFPLLKNNGIHYRPCNSLQTIIKARVEDDYYSLMKHVFSYMHENHLTVSDDILSVLIGSDMKLNETEECYDYYICYIPYKEE